jgi:hypothetical protein
MIGEGLAAGLLRSVFGVLMRWWTAPWTSMQASAFVRPWLNDAGVDGWYSFEMRFVNSRHCIVEISRATLKGPKSAKLANANQGASPSPLYGTAGKTFGLNFEINPATDRPGESTYVLMANLIEFKGRKVELDVELDACARDNSRTTFKIRILGNKVTVPAWKTGNGYQ